MLHSARARTEREIRDWLATRLERELELPAGSIDVRRPVSRYGLDSLAAVSLSAELEDWLGRELSPNILIEHPSIEVLAYQLAGEPAALDTPMPIRTPAVTPPPESSNTEVCSSWSPLQRMTQWILSFLIHLLCRLKLDGSGGFPASGPYVLATNHLHVLDTPMVFALLPSPAVFFVSAHMKGFRIANWFLSRVADTIWVSRGEGDVQAIQSALAVLRSGGVVAVAPEGKISKSGGLLKGQTGTAYLATQADVPILPIVAYGQEKFFRYWLRLQRVPVTVRIGALIRLPAGKATAKQLETYTDSVMVALARMLPEEYRGVYPEVFQHPRATARQEAAPAEIPPGSDKK